MPPAPTTVKNKSSSVRIKLLETFPNLLLILVPRHPERFPDAREMVQKAGMSFTLRSTGEILLQYPVVIGDTMGELMLLYGIADLAFVGGSWWSAAAITR